MARTLYVSDLDGTLLRCDQRLSDATCRTLNALIADGVLFSYATARSFHTARTVTAGLHAAFPAIVYNGTMIKDHRSGEVLWQHRFDAEEFAAIMDILRQEGIAPIVYRFLDGREQFAFIPERQPPAATAFLASRSNDERCHPVSDEAALYDGAVFYVTCIGDGERLKRAYAALTDHTRCLLQTDPYTGEPWLECMPRDASKAHAAQQLKAMLKADRLVVFGDGLNDMDLFAAADESYAVANAEPSLKTIATAVIGDHEQDSVAAFIADDAQKE